jgi:hypothetical protein
MKRSKYLVFLIACHRMTLISDLRILTLRTNFRKSQLLQFRKKRYSVAIGDLPQSHIPSDASMTQRTQREFAGVQTDPSQTDPSQIDPRKTDRRRARDTPAAARHRSLVFP